MAQIGLVCGIKYCNNLPDIPFEAKFVLCQSEMNRFVYYDPLSSLESSYQRELLTELDLSATIGKLFTMDPIPQLDLADQSIKFLGDEDDEDDTEAGGESGDSGEPETGNSILGGHKMADEVGIEDDKTDVKAAV